MLLQSRDERVTAPSRREPFSSVSFLVRREPDTSLAPKARLHCERHKPRSVTPHPSPFGDTFPSLFILCPCLCKSQRGRQRRDDSSVALSFFSVSFLVRREPDTSSAPKARLHRCEARLHQRRRSVFTASAARREAFNISDSVSIRLAPLIRFSRRHKIKLPAKKPHSPRWEGEICASRSLWMNVRLRLLIR